MAYYHMTKDGRRVVCGRPSEVKVGEVMVNVGTPGWTPRLVPATVVELGRPFDAPGGIQMVYGYLEPRPQRAPAKTTPRTPRPRRVNGPIYSAGAGGRCRSCGGTLDENPNLHSDGLCFDCMP